MPASYSVKPVAGIRKSERRSIAFLSQAKNPALDASAAFESLDKKPKRDLRVRFDHWIDGGHKNDWFHGWPDLPDYKDCFAFKWRENRQCHRLYGFLCNPQKKTNPRLRLCVLVYHETKNQWETNFTILDRVNRLRTATDVMAAVNFTHPDEEPETNRWPN